MIHIATIVGARPQFIKAATVSRALRQHDAEEHLIHTGQHYDANMSEVFFEELDIPRPDYHLGIGSLPHGAQTGRMIEAIEGVLLELTPDWVLIYGDTNSTLAGALAASKLHLRLAHVEAGLRSFNKRMPEEINRIVADHLSDLLFTPTRTAVANLRREGMKEASIRLVGDVMYDAALYYGEKAERCSRILERLSLAAKDYALVTIHRAENTDRPERLGVIADALLTLAKDRRLAWPLHPRTRAALERFGLLAEVERHLTVTEPVGYLDMIMLEKHAALVITDSGGVQKEAYFHGVPCVTLREETEWTELLEAGWNKLAPPDDARTIVRAVEAFAQHPPALRQSELYGSGQSASTISDDLLAFR